MLPGRSPDEVVASVVDVVARLSDGFAITAVGLGIGGRVGEQGVIRSAPFLEWEDVPLGALLESATGLPVVIDNDLVAFTEYEHWFGAGRDLDRFAVVTLGAGVGYGLVVNRQVIVDDDAGLGLVGHWPLDPFGPRCPVGHRGCAMSVLTSDAIVSEVGASLGRTVGYEEVLTLAEEGEPAGATGRRRRGTRARPPARGDREPDHAGAGRPRRRGRRARPGRRRLPSPRPSPPTGTLGCATSPSRRRRATMSSGAAERRCSPSRPTCWRVASRLLGR